MFQRLTCTRILPILLTHLGLLLLLFLGLSLLDREVLNLEAGVVLLVLPVVVPLIVILKERAGGRGGAGRHMETTRTQQSQHRMCFECHSSG